MSESFLGVWVFIFGFIIMGESKRRMDHGVMEIKCLVRGKRVIVWILIAIMT